MRKYLFCLIAAPLLMAPSPSDVRVVDGGGLVMGSVNGVPARLRVDPSALAIPLVTEDLARRAKLKPSFMSFEYMVGPKRIQGNSAVGRIDSGTGAVKRRIGWVPDLGQTAIDGVIGPGMMKESRVHFRLRPARDGEHEVTFPLVDQGGLEARWGERYGLMRIGGRTLRLQFDPSRADTLVNAQTGATLASLLGGRWDGAPSEASIAFGVARPVRPLRFVTPLAIGPVQLSRLWVRTQDFGSSAAISEGPPDPDEIVVLGGKQRDARYDVIRLGADVLDHCSSIVFDKRAKEVRLSCR